MTPYQILNVAPDATDAEIREAYLQLVRRYPPTQSPDRFTLIAKAHEKVNTPEKRLDYELLGDPDAKMLQGNLVDEVLELARIQRKRPTWNQLKQLMR